MSEKIYRTDEVEVVWKAAACIHSANCAKSLPAVFDPDARPWIRPEGASADELLAAVRGCPSGALTARDLRPSGEAPAVDGSVSAVAASGEAEDPGLTRVRIRTRGPVLVPGPVAVQLPDGTIERHEGNCAFCRCGSSKTKPYCDGSHRFTDFQD